MYWAILIVCAIIGIILITFGIKRLRECKKAWNESTRPLTFDERVALWKSFRRPEDPVYMTSFYATREEWDRESEGKIIAGIIGFFLGVLPVIIGASVIVGGVLLLLHNVGF